MSSFNRRRFLQFAGSTLASIGLSQADFSARADCYGRAIAQKSPRKWAMLVGVNDYPKITGISSLEGCLTDIDLQYYLLVNRFGFDPQRIVKVSDSAFYKPNRQTILEVFRTHLIKQVEPGDVVVFHYSGHGDRVLDPDPVYDDKLGLNGTIVPNDAVDRSGGVVPDIMGRTLFLLMRSLKTDNVTAILDACHSGGGLRGNAVVRAVPSSPNVPQPMPEELALQEQLLAELGLSFADFQSERREGVAKGLGIGSAQLSQIAYEAPYGTFKAGTFTYLLTRYLWQMTSGLSAERVRSNLVRSTRSTVATHRNQVVQVPAFQSAPKSDSLSQPIYFTPPTRGVAEAVVTDVVTDGSVEFWMGGVSLPVLELADAEAEFTVLNDNREPVGTIRQTQQTDLVGTGKLLSGDAMPGMLLRETVVGLPPYPSLRIGVDDSLGAEVETALRLLPEALRSAGRSQLVATRVDGQTPVDYILGRMTEEMRSQLQESEFPETQIPAVGTVLLFNSVLEPISKTGGDVGESVEAAIAHLTLRFKSLLVSKVLSAMSNIKSNMPIAGNVFAESNRSRSVAIEAGAVPSGSPVETEAFEAGEYVQIRLKNTSSSEAVYVSCVAIGSTGNMTVIYPNNWSAPEDDALMEPGAELLLPRPEDAPIRYQLSLDEDETVSYVELLTLVSTRSLRNSLRGLQEIASNNETLRSNVALKENQMLGWLDNLLGDVNEISRRGRSSRTAADRTAVSGGAIAIYSTLLEVVRSVSSGAPPAP